MRLFISTLCLLLAFSSFAQEDAGKKMAEFQKALSDPKAIPYGENAAAGKYYEIRGFKMYCEVYGTGEPLLIIHGNGGSIDNFIYQIPYFAKKYKVIIADSRSHGKSADPGDSLTYEMMADDYAALLDALKIDSANVIGWSDGGINGILLAQRHPGKVKKLAITGANLAPDTTAVPQEIWDMVRPSLAALNAKSTKTPQEKHSLKLLKLLCEQPHISPSSLQNVLCPALVIGGDHDVIKEEHTLLIYKNIPKAYLWILPGAGHSTPVIYAEDFNRVVDRFFTNPFVKIEGEARFM
ncbi:alpha/beta hydrolase [Terrimonas sp. NA20]|uniref:Alpha/beta hydrolase n=1 Tax=Terrimonas ginsenosidimutans TaxID=2908004 RepID=A0ABS9KQB3_9BACT|nr:alpha/beta hydrolase [Terrimonas ginsenosidimutans]MCG2614491.1 alpha/beta hydrolase [Terrimonas ginsenosidimutans]